MSQRNNAKEARLLIESDSFDFDFLSDLAEAESWRKEIYRPIYHVHKWWAKRLGSVFRGILLACQLTHEKDLKKEFYCYHDFTGKIVFDPFMGGGTTIGEAHKLGYTALGREINPVAARTAQVAFGSLNKLAILNAFEQLKRSVGESIRDLYKSRDTSGVVCDVLYYFWVKVVDCPECNRSVDLFPSYIVARNASPARNQVVQVLCPSCGHFFASNRNATAESCPRCSECFNPQRGPARGAKSICPYCNFEFPIAKTIRASEKPPQHRLYGKLLLKPNGKKVYLATTKDDDIAYQKVCERLRSAELSLPELEIKDGYNTQQVLNYGYRFWREFFNDRQLFALGLLHNAILAIQDEAIRTPLLTVFSGALEFNNMFASYKGEGTGAVRHMFSHHILKPERTPIEANVWGTERSSGAFSTLFKTRLLRCIEYREKPFEVVPPSLRTKPSNSKVFACSPPFTAKVESRWPDSDLLPEHSIFLSCGSSHISGLPSESVDYVVTDPPFFDNVHYSELADFFYAWQKLDPQHVTLALESTRQDDEVQDTNADHFTSKLKTVFCECNRVLRDEGLLVFTYHHSRHDGWLSLCNACMSADFNFLNAHPVKSEMSVAMPKSQAKEPIDIDMIIVCRKRYFDHRTFRDESDAWDASVQKTRLKATKYLRKPRRFSVNDMKILLISQLLVELCQGRNFGTVSHYIRAMANTIDITAQTLLEKLHNSTVSRGQSPPCSPSLQQMELFS
jgi:putative DNA methylase